MTTADIEKASAKTRSRRRLEILKSADRGSTSADKDVSKLTNISELHKYRRAADTPEEILEYTETMTCIGGPPIQGRGVYKSDRTFRARILQA